MNGVQPGASAEQRQARKRELLQELTLVRQQKADILRQLQVIAKKQRTVGPPPKASGLPPETRRQAIEVDHHRRVEGIWQACMKIMQDLLKNATVKLYFGEPVRLDYAPTYYDVIKNPMDLGTIKRACGGAGGQRTQGRGAAPQCCTVRGAACGMDRRGSLAAPGGPAPARLGCTHHHPRSLPSYLCTAPHATASSCVAPSCRQAGDEEVHGRVRLPV